MAIKTGDTMQCSTEEEQKFTLKGLIDAGFKCDVSESDGIYNIIITDREVVNG